MSKKRLATVWLGGCSGCHMSFLDLDERLLDLAELADVCYTPIADVKEFLHNVDITLVEGAVANEDHLRDAKKIRERSGILVAFGDCAITGNVTALRNLFNVEDVLSRAYRDSMIVGGVPEGDGIVPKLLEKVLRLQDVVAVYYFLPGCPPPADVIFQFVVDLIGGKTPAVTGRKFGS